MKRGLLSVLVAMAAVAAGHAAVYTWTDAQGVRHFSDSDAAHNARKADLPAIQPADGDPDALKKLKAEQKAEARKKARQQQAERHSFTLRRPKAEKTIRDAQGVVHVGVAIDGGSRLSSNERIAYYLDGKSIYHSPTRLTATTLSGVERGTHTVSAALLRNGNQVKRTAPRTFYMKPPAAISPLNANQGGGPVDQSGVPGARVRQPAGNVGGAPATPRVNPTTMNRNGF